VHATGQIGFDQREAVGQREGQLADGVGPGFGNVVAADGHAVEVAHVVVDKVFGNVTHDLQRKLGAEDAGVLALVFFQDVGLHRAAHVGQHPFADFLGLGVGGFAAIVGFELVQVLVDGGVHEHGQDAGGRAVDGHAHAGGGAAQVKAAVQHLHVVQRGHVHAAVADLAVDVGAGVGVVAVERDRIEGGGQAFGGHALRHQFEAAVGAEGVALAREHAGGVFAFALEGEGARGVREAAGHVVQHQPFQDFAVVFKGGQHHFADGGAAQAFGGERGADFFVADFDDVLIPRVSLLHGGPLGQQFAGGGFLVQFALLGQVNDSFGRFGAAGFVHGQHGGSGAQLLDFAGQPGLLAGALFVAAHGVGNFGQIAGARRGHDGGLVGAVAHGHTRQTAFGQRQAQGTQTGFEGLVEGGHAVVVEAGGHGAKHRHLVGGCAPSFAVALHLFAHVAQGIAGPFAVKFVDGDELGKVQHVDFFELAGGTEFGGHHVHGHIDMRHDGGIALPNAGRFHHDQIKPSHLAGRNDLGQGSRNFAAKVACGQAAHEDAVAVLPRVDGVHADAVAQQCAATLAPRGVNADDGHAQRIVLV